MFGYGYAPFNRVRFCGDVFVKGILFLSLTFMFSARVWNSGGNYPDGVVIYYVFSPRVPIVHLLAFPPRSRVESW